jgi:hypothetical protein
MMQSIIGTSALEAGTKQPTCASKMQVATCLMYVDLPPMLGPVMILTDDLPGTITQSLLIHLAGSWNSIKGCLDISNVSRRYVFISGFVYY